MNMQECLAVWVQNGHQWQALGSRSGGHKYVSVTSNSFCSGGCEFKLVTGSQCTNGGPCIQPTNGSFIDFFLKGHNRLYSIQSSQYKENTPKWHQPLHRGLTCSGGGRLVDMDDGIGNCTATDDQGARPLQHLTCVTLVQIGGWKNKWMCLDPLGAAAP